MKIGVKFKFIQIADLSRKQEFSAAPQLAEIITPEPLVI
jgi:hypothetical protein